jgi:hypothetical protein
MRTLLAAVVVVLALALSVTPSLAQIVANDAYQVGYFGPFEFADTMRIINTGQIGSPMDASTKHGTVCADIYIFDANQEMAACCSCALTANALTELRVFSPLTGVDPPAGVVKIVADAGCDETNITAPVNGGLRAFQDNIQSTAPSVSVTETLFQPAPLTTQEQQFLGQACSFVHYLGSGRGICACGFGG